MRCLPSPHSIGRSASSRLNDRSAAANCLFFQLLRNKTFSDETATASSSGVGAGAVLVVLGVVRGDDHPRRTETAGRRGECRYYDRRRWTRRQCDGIGVRYDNLPASVESLTPFVLAASPIFQKHKIVLLESQSKLPKVAKDQPYSNRVCALNAQSIKLFQSTDACLNPVADYHLGLIRARCMGSDEIHSRSKGRAYGGR